MGAALVVLFSHSGAQIFGWYFFPCFWTGAFLGGWWQNSDPSTRGPIFYLRAQSPARQLVLRPLAIASFAIAVFALLPLGWRVFAPIHSARFYLAGVSIGLCGYTLAVSRRWFGLSPNRGLRILGGLFGLALVSSIGAGLFELSEDPLLFDSAFLGFLFLWTPSRLGSSYLPSIMGIALHFGFAAGVLYGCWRVLQHIELSGYSAREKLGEKLLAMQAENGFPSIK